MDGPQPVIVILGVEMIDSHTAAIITQLTPNCITDRFGTLLVTLTMYCMPLVLRQSMSSAFCALPIYKYGAMSVGGDETMSSRNDAQSSGSCLASSLSAVECSDSRLSSAHGALRRSSSSSSSWSLVLQRFG